ncbi:hypothetical protein [Paenisporosarcina indica]
MEAYDPTNREEAMAPLMEHESLVTGIIYRRTDNLPLKYSFKVLPRHI